MTGRPNRTPTKPLQRVAPWALLATLGVLVGITVPDLGSGAWPFDPPSVDPRGILGALVRVADREWDLGILRSTAVLAGLLVALAAAATWRFRTWPRWAAIGLAGVVCAMLLLPAVLLQVGLRDATEPWYFTNDSTYQIEIAGDLVLDGDNPVRARLRRLGARALLPGGRRRGGRVRPRGPAPLRLLPGHRAHSRRLADPPAALGRLSPLRPACDLRAPARCVALPGAPRDQARRRRGPGRESADRPRRLVRHSGRARAACARALVRAGHPRAPGLGRSEPRRCGRAEAVRARRGSVPPRHAPRRPRPAAHALAGRRGLRRRLLRDDPPVPDRRSRCALGRHDRLRRRHVPHRRLRPGSSSPEPRRARRPLRLLPVPAARDPRLAPDHGLAPLEPVAV